MEAVGTWASRICITSFSVIATKKGFISKAFPGKQSCEIDYFTTPAESTTTLTVESTMAAESTDTESTAAVSSTFLPPQATIATAKPQTITDAINFFIGFQVLKFAQS